MKKGLGWAIAGIIAGIGTAVCSIVEIVADVKSAKYEEEALYEGIEERYGLEPLDRKEEENGES